MQQKDNVTTGDDNEIVENEEKKGTTDGSDAGNNPEVAQSPVADGDANGDV